MRLKGPSSRLARSLRMRPGSQKPTAAGWALDIEGVRLETIVVDSSTSSPRAQLMETQGGRYCPTSGPSLDHRGNWTAQVHMQAARFSGCELALVAPRERDATRCRRNTSGYGASSSRAFFIRDHPRSLLPFDPRGRSGSGAKSRRFVDWTQMDPSCGNSENWKLANSMMGFEPPTPWSRTSSGCLTY